MQIGSAQALINMVSLHKNIKLSKKSKGIMHSKDLYECSNGDLKIMLIKQTDDCSLI